MEQAIHILLHLITKCTTQTSTPIDVAARACVVLPQIISREAKPAQSCVQSLEICRQVGTEISIHPRGIPVMKKPFINPPLGHVQISFQLKELETAVQQMLLSGRTRFSGEGIVCLCRTVHTPSPIRPRLLVFHGHALLIGDARSIRVL